MVISVQRPSEIKLVTHRTGSYDETVNSMQMKYMNKRSPKRGADRGEY
jgi:hypothetical protein